jgi:hypothetical protein
VRAAAAHVGCGGVWHPRADGRLAQLGERLPYKQEVAGSIPAPPTEEGPGNGAFLVSVLFAPGLVCSVWQVFRQVGRCSWASQRILARWGHSILSSTSRGRTSPFLTETPRDLFKPLKRTDVTSWLRVRLAKSRMRQR